MIRFAQDDELDKLKPLFFECFDIKFYSPYGAFYITNIFKNYKTLAYIKDDKFVSMITLLPVKLLSGDKIFSGLYLFALGTLKDYRNLNIASEMLEYIYDYSKKNNIDFNLLIPEGYKEHLFNMYFKRGFKKNIKHKLVLLSKEEMNDFLDDDTYNLNFLIEDYNKDLKTMRYKNYFFTDFIEWDEKELAVVQKEYSLPGGNHYFLNFDSGQYAILDLRDESKLKIREYNISDDNMKSFIKTLLDKYPSYKLFEFSLPVNNYYSKFFENKKYEIKNIAMLRPINENFIFDEEKIYFNFGLDT